MRIVCVSDTHGRHHLTQVPDGDILVHAGDLTLDGSLEGVESFDRWLGDLPHRHNSVDNFTSQRSAAESPVNH